MIVINFEGHRGDPRGRYFEMPGTARQRVDARRARRLARSADWGVVQGHDRVGLRLASPAWSAENRQRAEVYPPCGAAGGPSTSG